MSGAENWRMILPNPSQTISDDKPNIQISREGEEGEWHKIWEYKIPKNNVKKEKSKKIATEKIFCTVLFKFYFRNSVIYILCKIFCLAFTKNVQSLFSQLCEYSNYGDFDFIFSNFPFSNCFYAKLQLLVSWYPGIYKMIKTKWSE